MVAHLIPEFCMKINEKLGLSLKDENHFISLLFTLWASLSASDFALRATTGQDDPTGRASRRLPSAALLRPRHPAISGIASALNALQMKASDPCKFQVKKF
jgi:hypothetical protein